MGQDFLPEGYEIPVRRRYQSYRYGEGTPEHEALQMLREVTRPDPSGETLSGQPTYISDADPDLARSIFAGLRPEMWATPSRRRQPYNYRSPSYRPWQGRSHALPPVPPDFTPSPFIVGTDTAKLFAEYAAINPDIKRVVRNITTGPDRQYIKRIFREAERIPGQEGFLGVGRRPLPESTLSGQITSSEMDKQDEPYRDIYINPHHSKHEVADILGHELGHTLFGSSENWSNRLAALLRQINPTGGRGGRIPFSLRLEDIP